jgi:hypothetical protein
MNIYILDLKQEKVHENLLHNVEGFDALKLHHADIKERKVLKGSWSQVNIVLIWTTGQVMIDKGHTCTCVLG